MDRNGVEAYGHAETHKHDTPLSSFYADLSIRKNKNKVAVRFPFFYVRKKRAQCKHLISNSIG